MSAARWPFVGTSVVLVFTAGAAAHWIPGYTVVDSNGTVTINVAAKLSSDEVLDPHPAALFSPKFVLIGVGVVVVSSTSGALGDARQFRPPLVLTSAFGPRIPVPDDPGIFNLEFDFIGDASTLPGADLGSFSFIPNGPGRAFAFAGQADDPGGNGSLNSGTVPASVPEPATTGSPSGTTRYAATC